MNQELAQAKKRTNEPAPEPSQAEINAQHEADFVILRILEPLQPKHSPRTVTRDRFIKKNPDWAPASREMAVFATTGALRSITKVHIHASPEKREASMLRRYDNTVNYANAAFDVVQLLNGGYNSDNEHGRFPDYRLIRTNSAILSEIAQQLANRNNLNSYHWPQDDYEQIDGIFEYLTVATPLTVVKAFEFTEKAKKKELVFWKMQEKKAKSNTFIKKMVNDSQGGRPRIKVVQGYDTTDDSKLLELAAQLDEKRRFATLRDAGGSLERYIPEDVAEMAKAIHDDASQESVRIRNLEDGSGASPYMARLNVLGVKGAGKAVAKVKEERFSGHSVPVRGSYQRLTADQPPQATEAQKVTIGEKAEIEGRTEIEKLVNSDGVRQLGAVLHNQPLKPEHDE